MTAHAAFMSLQSSMDNQIKVKNQTIDECIQTIKMCSEMAKATDNNNQDLTPGLVAALQTLKE